MTNRIGTFATALCLSLSTAWTWAGEPAAKPSPAKVRLGVYDSRAVAIAFVGSDAWKATAGKQLADQKAAYDKAKADGDQKRMAKLEAWGKAEQVRLHKQGFSTAPVDDLLKHVKEQIPEIVRVADVSHVVSKWDKDELAKYKSAELVDITMPLVKAFHPTERQLKAALDIQKQAPISLQEAERIDD